MKAEPAVHNFGAVFQDRGVVRRFKHEAAMNGWQNRLEFGTTLRIHVPRSSVLLQLVDDCTTIQRVYSSLHYGH